MTKTRSRKVLWLPFGTALRTIAGPDQDPGLSHHIGPEAPVPLLDDIVIGAPEIAGLDLDLLLDPIETTDIDLQTHQVDWPFHLTSVIDQQGSPRQGLTEDLHERGVTATNIIIFSRSYGNKTSGSSRDHYRSRSRSTYGGGNRSNSRNHPR